MLEQPQIVDCEAKGRLFMSALYSWQRNKGAATKECATCGQTFQPLAHGSRRKRCLACEQTAYENRRNRKWERIRKAVFARDEHTCAYCGYFVGHHPMVDHVMPTTLGGLDTPDNLVCACPECNLKKSDKYLSEFLAELGYKPAHNPTLLKCLDSEIRERRLENCYP